MIREALEMYYRVYNPIVSRSTDMKQFDTQL
jgi:hypothetical protein